MKPSSIHCARTCLVTLSLIFATGQSRAELAPDVREYINQGIAAANSNDYLLAIRHFQDARKIAPDAPEIYYDLGLAESKIPGRELRAIAWFGAYLAANPNAPNMVAVKDEIGALELKSHNNASRFILALQDAADRLETGREGYLDLIAGLWAGAGDMAAASKVVDMMKALQIDAQLNIAKGQLQRDDIAGAQSRVALMDAPHKDSAWQAIAESQIKLGDIVAATKTASLIRDVFTQGNTWLAIARAQAEANDISGAQTTVAMALKNAMVLDQGYKDLLWEGIAPVQASIGDIAGARNTVELIQDPTLKGVAQLNIGGSYTRDHPATHVITAVDWLEKLDGRNPDNSGLNTPLFLDLVGQLADLHSDTPHYFSFSAPELFVGNLYQKVQQLVTAEIIIEKMLNTQIAQAGKP